MPTLDDVVAKFRDAFTPAQAGDVVASAVITREEWNVLASFVYLRDAAKVVSDAPKDEAALEKLRDEVLLAESMRAGVRVKR